MAQVHPSYLCTCQAPRLKRHLGEDTGICDICNLIYDQQLYEMRLRQHVAGYTYNDLDEFLIAQDPQYAALRLADH